MSTRTISLDDRTYTWLLAHGTRESALAARLREETAARDDARMQISPEQGQLMEWLIKALGVRTAVEVGTFTGYSALRMATALPEYGHLHCCDIDPDVTAIGQRYWAEAGIAHRITLHIGPAVDTLKELLGTMKGTLDFIFLDADKESYPTYVDLAYLLLRPGGVVALDNVLWSGRVADPDDVAPSTVAIRHVSATLVRDERWDLTMLPIGDGLTLLLKR